MYAGGARTTGPKGRSKVDPDENYARQLELALRLYNSDALTISTDDAWELAELVIALNDWVANGGFPPKNSCVTGD